MDVWLVNIGNSPLAHPVKVVSRTKCFMMDSPFQALTTELTPPSCFPKSLLIIEEPLPSYDFTKPSLMAVGYTNTGGIAIKEKIFPNRWQHIKRFHIVHQIGPQVRQTTTFHCHLILLSLIDDLSFPLLISVNLLSL